jgi:UDP-3-O-[3-hydroxymyristoyl] glucosamine N-acyltransferase
VHRLDEIAAAIGARLEGRGDLSIRRAAEPADAGPEDLALAADPRYAAELARGRARAALLWEGADWQALGLEAALLVRRPRYALAALSRRLDQGPGIGPGIHPAAIVDPAATVGEDAAIGPFAVIGAGVVLGPGARIGPHVTVGAGTRIGSDVLLHAGVRIAAGVVIGDRFIAQPNAVVGGDGFSFVTPERSRVEAARATLADGAEAAPQAWARIHSLGGVRIGDDVELGALSAIDRGTIRDTVVGSGTKIDNLVQIGHNCIIGRDCMFCGNVGISGSVSIGDRVVLGGKVGVGDHVFIGDDVVAGGGTRIRTNVPKGRVILGDPAVKMETQLAINKALRRLPRFMERVAHGNKAVPKEDDSE